MNFKEIANKILQEENNRFELDFYYDSENPDDFRVNYNGNDMCLKSFLENSKNDSMAQSAINYLQISQKEKNPLYALKQAYGKFGKQRGKTQKGFSIWRVNNGSFGNYILNRTSRINASQIIKIMNKNILQEASKEGIDKIFHEDKGAIFYVSPDVNIVGKEEKNEPEEEAKKEKFNLIKRLKNSLKYISNPEKYITQKINTKEKEKAKDIEKIEKVIKNFGLGGYSIYEVSSGYQSSSVFVKEKAYAVYILFIKKEKIKNFAYSLGKIFNQESVLVEEKETGDVYFVYSKTSKDETGKVIKKEFNPSQSIKREDFKYHNFDYYGNLQKTLKQIDNVLTNYGVELHKLKRAI